MVWIPIFTEEEGRYFSFYCNTTKEELSVFSGKELWGSLVLQTCHHAPSIRKLVVAVGAMSLHVKQAGNTAQKAVREPNPVFSKYHYQFALHQYALAIKLMRESLASGQENIRHVLLWSLLINCFETYNGDHATASNHALWGLKALSYWADTKRYITNQPLRLRSPAPNLVEDDIVHAFNTIDCYLMTARDSRSKESHKQALAVMQDSVTNMPAKFATVQEGKSYWNLILQRFLRFLKTALKPQDEIADLDESHARPLTGNISSGLVDERNRIMKDLLHWDAAFQPVFERSQTPVGRGDRMSTAVLRADTKMWLVTMQVALKSDIEVLYDDHLSTFQEALSLVKTCCEEWELRGIATGPRLTSEVGVIPCLVRIALQCRDRAVRYEALHLLRKYPCQEGIWDSCTCAAAATAVVEFEEASREGGFIPAESRLGVTSLSCLMLHWNQGVLLKDQDMKLSHLHHASQMLFCTEDYQ
ncbi:hypothetical protein BP5796_09312 [Coleophoma crateriformis]|uniref:Uncharacterized protein n=1 Tax=Coleophoma crateriformis TaxID=565419 RepID=A0A3D8R3M9_9HELO|nr:hypothetical protein BP5796_09312 [Coleophoma crateriformis]